MLQIIPLPLPDETLCETLPDDLSQAERDAVLWLIYCRCSGLANDSQKFQLFHLKSSTVTPEFVDKTAWYLVAALMIHLGEITLI